jgi:hypothetical protein
VPQRGFLHNPADFTARNARRRTALWSRPGADRADRDVADRTAGSGRASGEVRNRVSQPRGWCRVALAGPGQVLWREEPQRTAVSAIDARAERSSRHARLSGVPRATGAARGRSTSAASWTRSSDVDHVPGVAVGALARRSFSPAGSRSRRRLMPSRVSRRPTVAGLSAMPPSASSLVISGADQALSRRSVSIRRPPHPGLKRTDSRRDLHAMRRCTNSSARRRKGGPGAFRPADGVSRPRRPHPGPAPLRRQRTGMARRPYVSFTMAAAER